MQPVAGASDSNNPEFSMKILDAVKKEEGCAGRRPQGSEGLGAGYHTPVSGSAEAGSSPLVPAETEDATPVGVSLTRQQSEGAVK